STSRVGRSSATCRTPGRQWPRRRRPPATANVMVHGAKTAQLLLDVDGLDELEIHVVPVLLGQGTKLFGDRGPEHVELERTRVLEGAGVTHLHFRVKR